MKSGQSHIRAQKKMTDSYRKKTVVICDTQPITAEGLRSLLVSSPDLEFQESLKSLESASLYLQVQSCDIVILDKAFGMQAVLDCLHDLKLAAAPTLIVWGVSITDAEALRLLHAGARGIVRKTAETATLLACLRTVASNWMEESIFRDSVRPHRHPSSELTPRENQVLELVAQGSKNKQIALELGIHQGTVKIHLKHIFSKTGVRGRYGLAISRLRAQGSISSLGE
jgi:DNA-binding NarL/FixJ family response regulator